MKFFMRAIFYLSCRAKIEAFGRTYVFMYMIALDLKALSKLDLVVGYVR